MKIVKLILPLGLLALASAAVHAQSIPALPNLGDENDGDLILGFSNASASSDLLVDVGPASNYYTAATAAQLGATGFTAPLTAGTTYTVSAYNAADLSTALGAGNAVSSSTNWTVFGGNGLNSGSPLSTTPTHTLWVSAPLTSTVLRETATNQQTLSSQLDTLTNSVSGGPGMTSPDSYIPGTKSFTLALTSGNNFGHYAGGPTDATTAATSSLILYELQPTVSGTAAAVDLGTFTLSSTGLTFSAIPEPSAYAAVLGALTLGFVMIRRRTRAAAFNMIG